MILLDTHSLIWFLEGDNKISRSAVSTIENNPGPTYVSMATLWEIAIKTSIGKLDINLTYQDVLLAIDNNAFKIISISETDIAHIISLPFHHRDPFDRLIIAQSQIHSFPIVTTDPYFKSYEVELIW